MRAGFHAVPSMRPLHLHLLSLDHDSEALKHKKHWNSFATPFFVPPGRVAAALARDGRYAVNKATEEGRLKAPMTVPLLRAPPPRHDPRPQGAPRVAALPRRPRRRALLAHFDDDDDGLAAAPPAAAAASGSGAAPIELSDDDDVAAVTAAPPPPTTGVSAGVGVLRVDSSPSPSQPPPGSAGGASSSSSSSSAAGGAASLVPTEVAPPTDASWDLGVADAMLIRRAHEPPRRKVAAFDMDGTLLRWTCGGWPSALSDYALWSEAAARRSASSTPTGSRS